MVSCAICLDILKSPMALPCGHVYCHECILSMIENDIIRSSTHHCPTCRTPYSITNVDPNAVPGHLRSSVLPALRKIYLDEVEDAQQPPVQMDAEVSKLRAENAMLRAYCETWKRRANLHSAVIYGVAKVAREQILTMRADREQLEQKYQILKRRHADLEAPMSPLIPTGDQCLEFRHVSKKRSGTSSNEPGSENLRSSPIPPPKKKLRSSTRSPRVKLETGN